MKALDAGHKYELTSLDGNHYQVLQFVKREGPGYPGNKGHYPGTTIQEVLRALIDRGKHVEGQIPCTETKLAIECMRQALWQLEIRAAKRHERKLGEVNINQIETYSTCPRCGHINCHHKEAA